MAAGTSSATAAAALRALTSCRGSSRSCVEPRTMLRIHLPRHILAARSVACQSCPSIARLVVHVPDYRNGSIAAVNPCASFSSNSSSHLFPRCCSSSEFPRYKNCKAAAAAAARCCSVDDHHCYNHSGDKGDASGIPSESFLRSSFSSSSSPSCLLASRSCSVLLGSSFFPTFRNGRVRNFCSGKPSLRLSYRRPRACSSSSSNVVNSGRYRGKSFSIEDTRSFSGDNPKQTFGGHNDTAEKDTVPFTAFRSRARRVVARASAAAGSSALPSRAPNNWWSTVWANFFALCASFASRLESIKIGWLDVLTMLRIVVLAVGAFGAYIASKRAWVKIREHASGKSGDEGGGGEGPMQVLARGATCVQSNMGPWSISDMALGLTAIAKVTEKEPPPLPGQEVKDLSQDPTFLLRAQHWRALSEAAYVKDSASFSLYSTLPESALVGSSWEPSQDSFRPAYAVFVDAPYGAVVLAVRGTSHIIDMLLNSGTSPEPFGDDGGYAHGGFVHAAKVLHEEVVPHIEKAFKDHGGTQNLKLVIVGHSMGAAVGSLIALQLRQKFPDLQCWGFCPPACMSLDLAKECKSFTTSFVAAHDLVPRFSLHSVEKLLTTIQNFDWDEVERVAKNDEDWQNIKKAMETFQGLQQAQSEAMEKLKGSGVPDSEIGQKAKDLGNKVLNTETGEKVTDMVKGLGNQANDYLEGNNEDQGDKSEGEDGDGKDSGEECSPPPLHPPGRLLVLGSDPPGCGKMPEQRSDVASQRNYGTYPTFDEAKNITWRMYEAEQEDLEEIVVSPWCISDHMLGNMCEAISYFQSRCPPAVK